MRSVGLILVLMGVAGCATTQTAREPSSLSMEPSDLSSVHVMEKPRAEIALLGENVPQETKDHVYLFFINGLDPYYLANFRAQCQYMKSLGYSNAYCGQMSHVKIFRERILQVRKDDPEARVIVVGYSFGANVARTLANQLQDDGAKVNLLVYLGGDTLKDTPTNKPANVERILNIQGHGSILLGYDLFVKGTDIQGATNHRLDSRHFLLPTRAEATELLVQHVVDLDRPNGKDRGVIQVDKRR